MYYLVSTKDRAQSKLVRRAAKFFHYLLLMVNEGVITTRATEETKAPKREESFGTNFASLDGINLSKSVKESSCNGFLLLHFSTRGFNPLYVSQLGICKSDISFYSHGIEATTVPMIYNLGVVAATNDNHNRQPVQAVQRQ